MQCVVAKWLACGTPKVQNLAGGREDCGALKQPGLKHELRNVYSCLHDMNVSFSPFSLHSCFESTNVVFDKPSRFKHRTLYLVKRAKRRVPWLFLILSCLKLYIHS